MGKDFRVGLITGVVLAGAALIWVATRPSLSLRARAPQAVQPPAETRQTASAPLPWETADQADADRPQGDAREPVRRQDLVQQVHNAGSTLPVPSRPAAMSPHSAVPANRATQPTAPSVSADLTIYETTEPIKTTRFHIVRKGESLSAIAQQYYGASSKWRMIVTANAKTLKDPNKIAPGTKLIIPE